MTKNIFDNNFKNLYSEQILLTDGNILTAAYSKSGKVRLFVNGRATTITAGGGGYDKCGTVFANYICNRFQELLKEKFDLIKDCYGVNVNKTTNEIYIDGACGTESVKRVLSILNLIK